MKVLVAEALAQEGLELLREHFQVDEYQGLGPEALLQAIGDYEALIVRSQTKVNSALIEAGRKLRVIGRAGTGVDNIDLEAATRRGIVVVNAPLGNCISVAEHTIALLLALARNIVQADSSLRAGLWERKKLAGVEVRGKVLGLIGLGRIGTEVARRAAALEMAILAYDPFVPSEHAARSGVRLVSLEELLRQADFISLHVPATNLTQGMIGANELALVKPTARLINCARGGILDEEALLNALEGGRLAGAALDVFAEEPPRNPRLLSCEKVILTPHLGASTLEAQRETALDVVEQVIAVLKGQPARYAVNLPLVSPEELATLQPYIDLAGRLGNFYALLARNNFQALEMSYSGEVAEYNFSLLTSAAISGLLAPISEEPVNQVNARLISSERGWKVSESVSAAKENFASLITMKVKTSSGERLVAGTVMRGEPHIVRIDEFWLDFVARGLLLVSEHIERPGIIGRMGTVLGEAGVSISFIQVGRKEKGGPGVMVLGLDDPVTPETLERIRALPSVLDARVVNLG